MQLNENTLTLLGTYPGGSIYRFVVQNSGNAPTTGVYIEGRATPESRWTTITDSSTDYTNLHGILGYSTTDGTLDTMVVKPGQALTVYIDCSRYTSIRVSATGLPGANAACEVTLPSGFPADIAALLVTPAGAGMIGVQPLAGILADDVQGALQEVAARAVGAEQAVGAATSAAAAASAAAATASGKADTAQSTANTAKSTADTAKATADAAAAAAAGSVRFDVAQTLTTAQQDQAKANLNISGGGGGQMTGEQIVTALGYTPWHAGNDGAGSGLDADTLDGRELSSTAANNTVVMRDSTGTIQTLQINLTHVQSTRNSDSNFFSGSDGTPRRNTATGFKTSLGIQNVSNTADADKPVSTAQQAALDAKLTKLGDSQRKQRLAYLDRGTNSTAGANIALAFDYMHQRLQIGAATTISTSGWVAGETGFMLLELVNGAAFAVTWPTINWVTATGAYSTAFSGSGVTLQSSGTDWVLLWSRDGGTTIMGKVLR